MQKGELRRLGHGIYRFVNYPTAPEDRLVEVSALLGARAILSHETALEDYGICDVSASRVHVTLPRARSAIFAAVISPMSTSTQPTTMNTRETPFSGTAIGSRRSSGRLQHLAEKLHAYTRTYAGGEIVWSWTASRISLATTAVASVALRSRSVVHSSFAAFVFIVVGWRLNSSAHLAALQPLTT